MAALRGPSVGVDIVVGTSSLCHMAHTVTASASERSVLLCVASYCSTRSDPRNKSRHASIFRYTTQSVRQGPAAAPAVRSRSLKAPIVMLIVARGAAGPWPHERLRDAHPELRADGGPRGLTRQHARACGAARRSLTLHTLYTPYQHARAASPLAHTNSCIPATEQPTRNCAAPHDGTLQSTHTQSIDRYTLPIRLSAD